ncbi:tetratricopeptide repeat-containing sulfotransferase family protein [Sphingomonas sanguinis]|nr:sulfotransferase [Sphingomonas sanguinis]
MTANVPDPALAAAADAMRRGESTRAMRLAKGVTEQTPANIDAWWLYAQAAMAAGRMTDAERAFAQGASRAAQSSAQARFLVQRARPLVEEGRLADAVGSVRAAVAAGLRESRDLVLAGFTLTHAGLPGEALPLAEQACAAAPDDADAWYNLGSIREYVGDRPGAQAALERAIAVSGGRFVAASYRLSHLRRWTANDNHIAALEAVTCRTPIEAARVAYALFKEHDDLGHIDAAWDCLQHGAAIMQRLEPWSRDDEAATVAAWRTHLSASAFTERDTAPREGPRRIFILGLPRSGTTLVERILAAHSQVHAMGEPKAFAIAVRRLAKISDAPLLDAHVVAAAVKIPARDIARFYTQEMAPFNGGCPVTIDKRTQNIHYVGLIRRAFPDAAIVALDRDPMDVLFGAYKRLFAGSHHWSYAQSDLADHFRHHVALVDHWAGISEIGLIRISLEALIADPEPHIRHLLDACGLSFEEACLRPHEAQGAVMTASATQVRRPINADGLGAWRRYSEHLKPLRDRLIHDGLID